MPVKVKCDCGKTLNVPDKYVGKRIECPACGKPLIVSSGAADDDLQIMPLQEFETGHDGRGAPPARPPSGRSAPDRTGGSPRRQRSTRRTRPGSRRKAPPSAPAPQPAALPQGSPEARCPSCKAILVPGVIVCTVCGLDLTTGRHISGAGRKGFQIRAVLGPLAAVGMVAALIFLWHEGYIKKWTARWRTEKEKPPAEAPEPPPPQKPGPQSFAAADYAGGAVEGVVTLSDATRPYSISTPIVVKKGAVFTVKQGVELKGKGPGKLEIEGGELRLEGTEDARVRLGLAVSTKGSGARRILLKQAEFSAPVVLKAFRKLTARGCSFLAPVQVAPPDSKGQTEVLFEECAFSGELKVRAGVVADRLKIAFRKCDFHGKVVCAGDRFAEVDLSECYWAPSSGLERPAKGLTVKLEPRLEGPASGLTEKEEEEKEEDLPSVSAEDVIVNREGSYSFLCPRGWKPIGRRGLRGPSSLGSPRLEILPGPESAAEGKKNALAGVSRASPVGLTASEITAEKLPAGPAETFELRYASLGKRYVKRYYVLEKAGKKLLLVWTFVADMEEKLAGTRDEVTSSFGFLGEE